MTEDWPPRDYRIHPNIPCAKELEETGLPDPDFDLDYLIERLSERNPVHGLVYLDRYEADCVIRHLERGRDSRL